MSNMKGLFLNYIQAYSIRLRDQPCKFCVFRKSFKETHQTVTGEEFDEVNGEDETVNRNQGEEKDKDFEDNSTPQNRQMFSKLAMMCVR